MSHTIRDLCLGVIWGVSMTTGIFMYSPRIIPTEEKVQSGYVGPGRLEIKIEDNDGNGQKETILEVKGKDKMPGKKYLLMEEDGEAVLKNYEVKPAEIVTK